MIARLRAALRKWRSGRAAQTVGYRPQTLAVGELEIRLLTPRDLTPILEAHGRGEPTGEKALPLVGIVWPSGELLAELMLSVDIEKKRVLEVGCGLALASHVLNLRGADVTALDIHPVVAQLIETNAAFNDAKKIPFVCDSWANASPELGQFDLIIGSDILYEPMHVRPLAPFIDRHALPTSEMVLVDPERGQLEFFVGQMDSFGFSCERDSPAFEDSSGIPFRGSVCRFRRAVPDLEG